MNISVRSHLTAGVAAFGVGAIVLSPVQPLERGAGLPTAFTSTQAVQLTAIDVITPWLEVFNDAETNVANLFNSFLGPNKSNAGDGNTIGAPLASLQQAAANWLGFAAELPDVISIWNQFVDNSAAALKAPFAVDKTTLDTLHGLAYDLLPSLVTLPQTLLNLMTTSLTGILVGAIGPVVGPLLALSQSVTDIINAVSSAQWSDALNAALNIPAKMVGAFLNGGQVLDLTWLAPVLGFPPLVTKFGLAMGGLLSPGGSLFNALDVAVTIEGDTLEIPGVGAGPIGSLMGFDWAIASAIGWKRNGNPLKPGIPVPTLASQQAAGSASAVAETESATPELLNTELLNTESLDTESLNTESSTTDSSTTDSAADDSAADDATPMLTTTSSGGGSGAIASGRKASRGGSTGSHAGKSGSKRSTHGAARSAASHAR